MTQHDGSPVLRLQRLDVLRAVAILLVLGRHLAEPPDYLRFPLNHLFELWHRAGWMGVDLFFVLSGFLVGGLLFREHRERGELGVGRFLVRRAFKIYPPFYVMLAVTLLTYGWLRGHPPHWRCWAGEVLFLQNYLGSLWNHTWSLAVEEHFYILLPLVLLSMWHWHRRRHGAQESGPGGRYDSTPFARLPWLWVGVALLLLVVRCLTRGRSEHLDYVDHVFRTHIRLDGLFFGVVLAYYRHYHAPRFGEWIQRWRWVLLLGGLGLLSPVLVLPLEHWFMHTGGFVLTYLGSGAVLLANLAAGQHDDRKPWPWRALLAVLGFVGMHSYSIYLWHMLVQRLIVGGQYGVRPDTYLRQAAWYMIASLVVGIVLAKLIEIPALRLRDRWFPAASPRRPSAPLLRAVAAT